jgi:formylglycine-generating enzyme required for sulfatase activity
MEDKYINSLGIKMVLVPKGSFVMGSDDEHYWDEAPMHKVDISKPFYISEDLITIEQYKKFRPDHYLSDKYSPYVTGISWYEADEFCKWLSTQEGLSFRLPTEAEWEYVSGKNEIKLNNLFTNKLEWCLDWYGEYEEGSKTDPFGAISGACKVIKGGSPDCIDGEWIPDKKGGPAHYSYLYEDSQFENTALNFRRPSNRAGLPPGTGCFQNDKKKQIRSS